MKTHLSLIFFIVLFSSSVHAQQGNTRSYPIEVGTYNSEFVILIHKTRRFYKQLYGATFQ